MNHDDTLDVEIGALPYLVQALQGQTVEEANNEWKKDCLYSEEEHSEDS